MEGRKQRTDMFEENRSTVGNCLRGMMEAGRPAWGELPVAFTRMLAAGKEGSNLRSSWTVETTEFVDGSKMGYMKK